MGRARLTNPDTPESKMSDAQLFGFTALLALLAAPYIALLSALVWPL